MGDPKPPRRRPIFDPDAGVAAPVGDKAVQVPAPPNVKVTASSLAPTRFPELYDRNTQQWNSAYLFPKGYELRLQLGNVRASPEKPVHWSVESLENKFGTIEVTDTGPRPGSPPSRVGTLVPIPTAGRLKVRAIVGEKPRMDPSSIADQGVLAPGLQEDGPMERTINLRDYLIASIGDSFSSGQGNPDTDGVPTHASRAMCEMTTLWQITDKLHSKLLGVPGIGDAVGAVEDIAGELFDWLGADEIPVHMDPGPRWLEPRAWRSLKSAPYLASQAVDDAARGRLVTFITVASSGATIDEGLLAPQRSHQKVGQIDELAHMLRDPRDHREHPRLLRPIDVLVLSIGGNDVGFAGTLSDMTTEKILIGMLWSTGATKSEIRRRIRKSLAELPGKYDQLAEVIKERLQPNAVVIPEYPTALFDGDDRKPTDGCGLFDLTGPMGLDRDDASLIEELGAELNEVLRDAASRNGWFLVDGIAESFKGHGYCSSDPWFVAAEDSCNRQDDLEGTMHPNQVGTGVVASAIKNEIIGILNQLDDRPGGGQLTAKG